ncbi:TetR/AcrR family transcriptional regulator C-terminal domain-containing protein [Kitasatospora sp. NPDC048540]|uniref:TetR/AcrR family transcriptional regulator C-terminal domain-containing protein n=2 Tax=unclassified Kitasatospora TaxID=2633591 RepID=UPI0033C1C6DF
MNKSVDGGSANGPAGPPAAGGTGPGAAARIAAELRRRIAAGELAPGDRVPSTREITRQWGVAMATATKALTELRHQGLVHAVPGVGTVVAARPAPVRPGPPAPAPPAPAPPARRRAVPEQTLALAPIVTAAIAVADAEGLAAVSMRRVAAELGVATMSLYRHVADKDALVVQMLDTALAGWSFPAGPQAVWRDRLEAAARDLWSTFRRHPWLAPAMSLTRPQPLPGAMPFSEWVLATLAGQGLDLQTAFTCYLALINYIRGTAVNLETEAEAQAATGLDSEEWMDAHEPELRAVFAAGGFPTLDRLATEGYDFDLDLLFEFGLQRILDGIAVLVATARP